LLFFYRIRVHYTVLTQHTTPHTTPNQTKPKIRYHQADLAYIRGDSIEQQPCCSRYPTACHTNKTNQTKTQTHLPKPLQPANQLKKLHPAFVPLILKPHT